jgi:hypothetical protein
MGAPAVAFRRRFVPVKESPGLSTGNFLSELVPGFQTDMRLAEDTSKGANRDLMVPRRDDGVSTLAYRTRELHMTPAG